MSKLVSIKDKTDSGEAICSAKKGVNFQKRSQSLIIVFACLI